MGADVEGDYLPEPATSIPNGFAAVCKAQRWDVKGTWARLNGDATWYRHAVNKEAYIYWNKADGQWWIDGIDGNGVFIAKGPASAPPANGWNPLNRGARVPTVKTIRKDDK